MITIFQRVENEVRQSQDPSFLTAIPKEGEQVWVDLETPTPEEVVILTRVFGFHALAIEDCWQEPRVPKIDDYGDYLFMVFHGVRYDSASGEFETHELNAFLGPTYLVTFHTYRSRSIEGVKENVQKQPRLMGRGMDFILHQIMDRVIDGYLPKMQGIEERMDEIEKAVLTDPKPELLTDIFHLRRSLNYIKRIATQEREVLSQISQGEFSFVSEKSLAYFKDIYDHLFLIVEVADSHRETLAALIQVHVSMVSNRLNDTMRVLTVIATLMLPLTVITGIYGMNFKVMPELNWKYGYPLTLLAMAVVGISMIVFFRRRKWL